LKNFLKNHGLWILFAAAVISVALAVLSFFSSTSSPLTNLAGILASPFRAAYTEIATWFNDKQNYYKDTTALEAENAALKRRIAEMERAVRQGEEASAENERLWQLLNLHRRREDFQFEPAFITEHTVTNWTSSLTLDKGTKHDVAVNDCVIDETGALVGVVSKVGYNWCTVLTIADTDTSLGAQVFRTKDLGLAVGDFALMGGNRLRLDYLPAGCQLVAGDLVQTSGLGVYYPSGLTIGSVDEVQVDDSGSVSYAILAPAADFDQLTEVFVITSFDDVVIPADDTAAEP